MKFMPTRRRLRRLKATTNCGRPSAFSATLRRSAEAAHTTLCDKPRRENNQDIRKSNDTAEKLPSGPVDAAIVLGTSLDWKAAMRVRVAAEAFDRGLAST